MRPHMGPDCFIASDSVDAVLREAAVVAQLARQSGHPTPKSELGHTFRYASSACASRSQLALTPKHSVRNRKRIQMYLKSRESKLMARWMLASLCVLEVRIVNGCTVHWHF